jgi:hypothetical protein
MAVVILGDDHADASHLVMPALDLCCESAAGQSPRMLS